MSYPVQMCEFQDVLKNQAMCLHKENYANYDGIHTDLRNLEICMRKCNVSNTSFSSWKMNCMHNRCHFCETFFKGPLYNWPPFHCL